MIRSCLLVRGALALLLGAAAAAAQDAGSALGGNPDTAEILLRRISDELEKVDAALQRAAEADVAAKDVEAAKQSHVLVIRDIEELIKQVKYQKSNSSSGQGGGEDQGSGGGLSGKPESRPSDGSSAPKPTGGKAQDQPQEGAQDQAGQGRQPRSGDRRDTDAGANEPAAPPPPDPVSRFTRTDTDARWGLLPPKLQERLMNLHVDDVPERYRAWLEAYIHALNSREQEAGGK